MKKTISLLLAGLMLLAMLAGCAPAETGTTPASTGGSSTGTASTTPEDPKDALKTDIQVWQFMQYEDIESMFKDDVLKTFGEEYKNVKVNLEILNGDTGPEKIMVAMGSGSTPDLLLDIASRVIPAVAKGLAASLTDLRSELGDILPESSVSPGLVDGEYYYISTALARGYHMTINMGLAEELGVDHLLPEDHETWSYDDFLTFCRETVKAGAKDDIKAVPLYAGSRSSDSMYYSFMMTGGADVINADHTAAVANSPEGVKFFDLLKTLVDEELCLPGAATLKDVDLPTYFYSGKVISLLSAAGYGNSEEAQRKIDEGAAAANFRPESFMYPTPDGKSTPKVLTFGSAGAVVFKNAGDESKIEAAKRLLKEVVVNPGYNQAQADRGAVVFGDVTYTYANDWLKGQAELALEWDAKYATSVDGVATLETWWGDVREVFYPELQALYTGNKTSQQALDDFVQKANAAIAAAGR